MNYHLACDTCQVIDRGNVRGGFDLDNWEVDHDGHQLSLVALDLVDTDRPRPGWTARPRHGPPLPGHAQPVVCPIPECGACGEDSPTSLVVWKRNDAGDTFLYCRRCGYTWGPATDAERARHLLRSLEQ